MKKIKLIMGLALALFGQTTFSQTPIGCNGQYYVSYGEEANSNSTTSMSKLSFAGSSITPNAFITDPTNIGFNGLGINPIDGFMYGVRYNRRLIRISDDLVGNVVDLGPLTATGLGSFDIIYAGCFDTNGDFYFLDNNNTFYKLSGLNHPTVVLAASRIDDNVSPESGFFLDIAIDPTDGQLYGVSGTGTTNKNLYSINKATGALTYKGEYSGSSYIASLFFDELGNLYGFRQDGTFQKIDKTDASLENVGTGPSYTYADGCSCSFGRVFHDLDFTANPGNQLCPTQQTPNPIFPMVVSVTNQSNTQKIGLTYTLNIVDPMKRFRFTESAATIKTNLIAAGLATGGSTVTLTTEAPATGTNYNKLVVTGFQTGLPTEIKSFTLQLQLYTLGGIYTPVPLQSVISGLPATLGSVDLSNDPTSPAPDDATVISFCNTITLPVSLTSFTASRLNRTNVGLRWVTASEQNNSGFEIERQIGTGNWEPVTFVASQAVGGNSQSELVYSHTDMNDSRGITQYRLRQVDLDGKATYSEIRSVRGEGQPVKLTVYPNPTTDGRVNIVFDETNAVRNVSVMDMSGRVVRQINGVTNNNITIENLNPGMYTVRVVVPETGAQGVEKIIVNKR